MWGILHGVDGDDGRGCCDGGDEGCDDADVVFVDDYPARAAAAAAAGDGDGDGVVIMNDRWRAGGVVMKQDLETFNAQQQLCQFHIMFLAKANDATCRIFPDLSVSGGLLVEASQND